MKKYLAALLIAFSAAPVAAETALFGDSDIRFYAGNYDDGVSTDTFWYLPNTKTPLDVPEVGIVMGINMVQKLYNVEVPFTMFISCEQNVYITATPLFDGTIYWGDAYIIDKPIELEVKRFVCR